MKTVDRLRRQEISDTIGGIGWRFVLGVISTSVRVRSLGHGAAFAARASADMEAGDNMRVDLRDDRVVLTLQDAATGWVTQRELQLAERISALASDLGLRTSPSIGDVRSVQRIEIAIDAVDIVKIRPFWKAITAYDDEANATGPQDPLVDPWGQGPAIWFQKMGTPRTQRNRIHFDISVPHDEAARRVDAAIGAGGVLLSDDAAPAFWVLADAEGNEVCVTTWQGRDRS